MEKFFSIFGKVILVILIIGAMTYGGYYFGIKTKEIKKPQAETTTSSENLPTSTPTPTQTTKPLITINGGVPKSAGLSYDQYSLQASGDWVIKRENQTVADEKLYLSKDDYQITIFQGETGGALCLYSVYPDFEGPSSRYNFFKELTSKDNRTLRRSGDLNGLGFTICQKYSDGSFGQPTNYG
ncbi:MAG: hypothetical protein Q7T59_05100, partial [Candidatus Woesebacteria bacterium]|nr:hypothetical protein [Candidatus Woesebacteria bacterium]